MPKLSQNVAQILLPAIRSLERRAKYLFYCMFFFVFCSLFCQRFLDNPRADSFTPNFAFWCILVPDESSPLWGLAAPAGRKKGKWNFRYYRSQWGILAFWWFLSDISATRGRIDTKFYLCRDNVCRRAPSPLGSIGPLRARAGELKLKKWEWSHSCCGQLPFLFFSALPNVVQYVGHRPAHILV